MATPKSEIHDLLAKPDEALELWYRKLMAAEEDPDIILSSGQEPTPRWIEGVFNRWFEASRSQLRSILCDRLGYARIGDRTKAVGEVAMVTTIASLLAQNGTDIAVDPVVTAVVLVTRRKLDDLCKDELPGKAKAPA